MKLSKIAVISVAVFCMISVSVNGATIPLSNSGWSIVFTGDTVGGGEVSVPYIYGVGNGAVTIGIDKTFNGGYSEPISIHFEKTSANAVSNIIISDEYVVNNTGTEWFGFQMNLISSTAPMAGFNPSYMPDGHQLENVYFSNNTGYNGLPIELNFADVDGEGVLTSIGDDIFLPGYESGYIMIVTNPLMQVGESFVLQEVASVPEPLTALLLGMGGLAVLRKKKQAAA